MEITRDHKVAVAQWLRQHTKMTVVAIAALLEVSERTAGRFLADFYDGKIGKVESFFDTKAMTFKKASTAVAVVPSAYKLVVTNKTITVIKDGKVRTADKNHRMIEQIRKAVDKKDYATAYDLINDKSGVKTFANGMVEVFEGHTIFNGVQLEGEIGKKIVQMVQDGHEDVAGAFSNFLVRVMKNPDDNMVERLFAFCQYNDIKIDPQGYVETYKIVRSNYMDCYKGIFDNTPGKTCSIERKQVDSNPDATCSYGLHVCSIAYLSSSGYGNVTAGGGRVVLCRVDPADFVAVPRDYNNRKARVCSYDVLKDVTGVSRKLLGIDRMEDDAPEQLKRDRAAFLLENGKLSED